MAVRAAHRHGCRRAGSMRAHTFTSAMRLDACRLTRHASRGAACVARMAMRDSDRNHAAARHDRHLAARSCPLVYSASQHCPARSAIRPTSFQPATRRHYVQAYSGCRRRQRHVPPCVRCRTGARESARRGAAAVLRRRERRDLLQRARLRSVRAARSAPRARQRARAGFREADAGRRREGRNAAERSDVAQRRVVADPRRRESVRRRSARARHARPPRLPPPRARQHRRTMRAPRDAARAADSGRRQRGRAGYLSGVRHVRPVATFCHPTAATCGGTMISSIQRRSKRSC
ncbi:conserved hypothetical protein [Burkholderia cenocepacia]|nr:conserved hypothetical protein [Burkholderia cenocepacia]